MKPHVRQFADEMHNPAYKGEGSLPRPYSIKHEAQ